MAKIALDEAINYSLEIAQSHSISVVIRLA